MITTLLTITSDGSARTTSTAVAGREDTALSDSASSPAPKSHSDATPDPGRR